MENSKNIERERGEKSFAPIAEHLRRVVDVTRNASLEDRLKIKKMVYSMMYRKEIEELKHFVEGLESDQASDE